MGTKHSSRKLPPPDIIVGAPEATAHYSVCRCSCLQSATARHKRRIAALPRVLWSSLVPGDLILTAMPTVSELSHAQPAVLRSAVATQTGGLFSPEPRAVPGACSRVQPCGSFVCNVSVQYLFVFSMASCLDGVCNEGWHVVLPGGVSAWIGSVSAA